MQMTQTQSQQKSKLSQKPFNEFEKFGIATGCKLKESKTKGLIISNKNTEYLEQMIKKQNNVIKWNEDAGLKILGIMFFTDELQTTNYNWKTVIDKLKRKTDILKTRSLSLRGKVILLNSVTLAKISFKCNSNAEFGF